MRLRFILRAEGGIAIIFDYCNNFLFLSDSVCPTPPRSVRIMNRNPILPNWQFPRRRPFSARRGVALLRAWRLRLTEQTQERFVQMQVEFGQIVPSRR